MKPEKQVCSLELAKKLKKLGVKQESLWYWQKNGNLVCHKILETLPDINDYSAFTVAELGEMLPRIIKAKNKGLEGVYKLKLYKNRDEWLVAFILWRGKDCLKCVVSKTEANARAKMRIYLLENKLIKL